MVDEPNNIAPPILNFTLYLQTNSVTIAAEHESFKGGTRP